MDAAPERAVVPGDAPTAAPTPAPAEAARPGPTRLVFVDTEATGLDHRVHQLTEVAWIARDGRGGEVVRRFVPEHDLTAADPRALEVSRYHERLAAEPRTPDAVWLDLLLGDAQGAVLVGVVPDFDARHLLQACQRAGRIPTWDHHLIDVGVLAMPLLADAPEVPRGVASLCTSLDVPFDPDRAHGALYDADRTMACFDRVWELLGRLRADGLPLPPPVPRPPSSRDGDAGTGRGGTDGSAAGLGKPSAEQVERG